MNIWRGIITRRSGEAGDFTNVPPAVANRWRLSFLLDASLCLAGFEPATTPGRGLLYPLSYRNDDTSQLGVDLCQLSHT